MVFASQEIVRKRMRRKQRLVRVLTVRRPMSLRRPKRPFPARAVKRRVSLRKRLQH